MEDLPWSEQKNPWWHLEQASFGDALVIGAGTRTGTGTALFLVADGVAITGFSVVCFPVLHLQEWTSMLQIDNEQITCFSSKLVISGKVPFHLSQTNQANYEEKKRGQSTASIQGPVRVTSQANYRSVS